MEDTPSDAGSAHDTAAAAVSQRDVDATIDRKTKLKQSTPKNNNAKIYETTSNKQNKTKQINKTSKTIETQNNPTQEKILNAQESQNTIQNLPNFPKFRCREICEILGDFVF